MWFPSLQNSVSNCVRMHNGVTLCKLKLGHPQNALFCITVLLALQAGRIRILAGCFPEVSQGKHNQGHVGARWFEQGFSTRKLLLSRENAGTQLPPVSRAEGKGSRQEVSCNGPEQIESTLAESGEDEIARSRDSDPNTEYANCRVGISCLVHLRIGQGLWDVSWSIALRAAVVFSMNSINCFPRAKQSWKWVKFQLYALRVTKSRGNQQRAQKQAWLLPHLLLVPASSCCSL